MRDTAPRSAAQRQMMLTNRLPQSRYDRRIPLIARRSMQLRDPDQIPAQLIRLAGRDLRRVGTRECLRDQLQLRPRLRLFDDARRELQINLVAGGEVQLDRGIEQHRRRHAEVIAQLGDVDFAECQRPPAQVADSTRRVDVPRVSGNVC